jgi:hypothetical protein
MRLTMDRRRAARVGVLVAAAVFALAGCDSRKGGMGSTTTPGDEGLAGPDSGPSVTRAPSPKAAAEAILKSLSDGKATAENITPAFIQKVAPPKTDDEKKAGYSDKALRAWLGRFEETRFNFFGDPAAFGSAVAFRGRAETGPVKDAFSLRLVKAGDGYKIDWLQRAERMGTEFTVPPDADLAAAQDAIRNFLDALLSTNPSAAQLSMAPAWRKAIAPPPPNSADDYEAGFLTQTLKSWKVGAVAYTLPKQELTANKTGAVFTAVLDAGGGKQTPYAAKLSKDPATGHWVVESFDKQ